MIDPGADISTLQVPVQRLLTRADLKELKHVEVGKLPNQRFLIIPDPGMTFVDMDLNSADPHFVAWEANDDMLKQTLKEGKSVHLENAKAVWHERVTKDGPEYKLAKIGGNAINYGAYPKKLAMALGITMKLSEWFYHRYFQIHPGIREWHNRTRNDLATKRRVRNAFGFERYYFDRPENCLNEALAWVPQSSVGIIINTAWANIDDNVKKVEVLMQVHDSLDMQVETQLVREMLPLIQRESLIVVPYEDPLIIPVGFKVSTKSWGDVADPCWEKPKVKGDPMILKDAELLGWLKQGLENAKAQASH